MYSGDVVLLELDTPLEFGDTVTAACLNDEQINDDAETCMSVGWYSEQGSKGSLKSIIEKLRTELITTLVQLQENQQTEVISKGLVHHHFQQKAVIHLKTMQDLCQMTLFVWRM